MPAARNCSSVSAARAAGVGMPSGISATRRPWMVVAAFVESCWNDDRADEHREVIEAVARQRRARRRHDA